MTAAMNPQLTPVAMPRKAARRVAEPPLDAATAAPATAAVARPPSHHDKAGACGWPCDGEAARRNTLTPADIATAASHSCHRIPRLRVRMAR